MRDFIFDRQTLVGAGIALIAALITVCQMRCEARKNDARHQDTLKRRKFASRARLPDALSELCRYTEGIYKYLLDPTETIPMAPTESLSTLKDAVLYIDNSAAKRVFELVSSYQIHRARIEDCIHPIKKTTLDDQQYDAALIRAYASSLFEYARNQENEAPTSPPSKEEMMTALKNSATLKSFVTQQEKLSGCIDLIVRRHS